MFLIKFHFSYSFSSRAGEFAACPEAKEAAFNGPYENSLDTLLLEFGRPRSNG